MTGDVKALLAQVETEIHALSKFRLALHEVLTSFENPVDLLGRQSESAAVTRTLVFPSDALGDAEIAKANQNRQNSLRHVILGIFEHDKSPKTAEQLVAAAVDAGWHTRSGNPNGLMAVELRKFWLKGELARVGRTRPVQYRLPKSQPWEKKLATARALGGRRAVKR